MNRNCVRNLTIIGYSILALGVVCGLGIHAVNKIKTHKLERGNDE